MTISVRRAARLAWAATVATGCLSVVAFQFGYTAWAISLFSETPHMLVLPALFLALLGCWIGSEVQKEIRWRRIEASFPAGQ
jgi:hypothetical protein